MIGRFGAIFSDIYQKNEFGGNISKVIPRNGIYFSKIKKVKKRFAFLIFFYKLVRAIYTTTYCRMSKEEKIEVE